MTDNIVTPLSQEALEAWGRALKRLRRKNFNRSRYERRFHRHAPIMKRVKVRTEAQRNRAMLDRLAHERKVSLLGLMFRGALDWLKGKSKPLAVPRGQYHHATRKGPGRRPLHPRHHIRIDTDGAKWLPRGFPRGY
jgi:hypothetical protein